MANAHCDECRRDGTATRHRSTRCRRSPDQIGGASREEYRATGLGTLVRSNQSADTVGDIPDTCGGVGVRGRRAGQGGDHTTSPAHLHLCVTLSIGPGEDGVCAGTITTEIGRSGHGTRHRQQQRLAVDPSVSHVIIKAAVSSEGGPTWSSAVWRM